MLLTAEQVASRLGVSRVTLYNWLKLGRFPKPVKLNVRCVRWPEEVVEDFLRAHGQENADATMTEGS